MYLSHLISNFSFYLMGCKLLLPQLYGNEATVYLCLVFLLSQCYIFILIFPDLDFFKTLT